MDLHRRPSRMVGYQTIVTTTEFGVGLDLLRLAPGTTHRVETPGEEMVLVLLEGHAHIQVGAQVFDAERESVWTKRATAVYVPPGNSLQLSSETGMEMAICRATWTGRGTVQVVPPSAVKVQERGTDLFQRRVEDIVAEQVTAGRLVIGETYNRPGQWSSYPPHKHDTDDPPHERSMDEVYLFRIRPSSGFAFQGLYTADGAMDRAYRIQNGDVMLLPCGYHPVAAAPGYEVYYLWALAGKDRRLTPRTDPAHAWITMAGLTPPPS